MDGTTHTGVPSGGTRTDHGFLQQRLHGPTIALLKSRVGHSKTVGSENNGAALNARIRAKYIISTWRKPWSVPEVSPQSCRAG